MLIYQNEQYNDSVRLADCDTYDLCNQIVITVYRKNTADNKLYFVKTADTRFPEAKVMTYDAETQLLKLEFLTDETRYLREGIYVMELMRETVDNQTHINKVKMFEVVKSNIY